MKTREELTAMTVKQLKEYANEIGCCLGYDAARKDSTINAIECFERCSEKKEGDVS